MIELMVVVAILGVLAVVALPAYQVYLKRSRSAEVPLMFNGIYASAASYYALEVTSQGTAANIVTSCIVGPDKSAWAPSGNKHRFRPTTSTGFSDMGFATNAFVFYNYEIDTGGKPAACGVSTSRPDLYTFRAHGDLDDDGRLSTFELSVGVARGGGLYRGVGFYISDELE